MCIMIRDLINFTTKQLSVTRLDRLIIAPSKSKVEQLVRNIKSHSKNLFFYFCSFLN